MRKSGLSVPVAALLSGVLVAGAAAQETGRDAIESPTGAVAATKGKLRDGNPLWAIPISGLSETHARPLFSPTRRPPAPPVVAALPTQPKSGSSPKPEPDHPRLTLLGTIVGESVEIAVFVDEASHDVIRLRAGEAHDGWTLHAVAGRAATFEKAGSRAATLALPAPRAEAAAASGGAANPVAHPVAITVAPPVIQLEPQVIPSTTRGGAKRPPKEG